MFVTALLVGCSSLEPNEMRLTINTEPAGAMLYDEGGTSWGMAPQSLRYTASVGSSFVYPRPITAVWPSGARKTYSGSLKAGEAWEITISRPIDAPGMSIDMAHAARIQSIKAQKEAADSAAAAAYILGTPSRTTRTNCINTGAIIDCTSK